MLTRIAWKMSSQGCGGSQEHVKLASGVLARLQHVCISGRRGVGHAITIRHSLSRQVVSRGVGVKLHVEES
jgi:hypothetical protein